MEITKTKNIKGLTITVTVEKRVDDDTSYMDGLTLSVNKKIYEHTTIILTQGNKKYKCSDLNFFRKLDPENKWDREIMDKTPQVYADFSGTLISRRVYDAIIDTLAEANKECTGSEEFLRIKNKKEEKTEKRMEVAASDGWCDKCQSYCYGDCDC